VNIQVKAIRDRKSMGWPIMKNRIQDGVLYVFVCLNAPGTPPDYFVCLPDEARENTAQYATRGIVDLRKLKYPQFQERWDKIENALAVPAERARPPRNAARKQSRAAI